MYSRSVTLDGSSKIYKVPEFVQLACSFSSSLMIRNNHGTFDTKSIMGMMSFNPRDGVLTITGEGSEEQTAVDALVHFLSGEV